jgi:hypothetical protein
MSGSRFTGREVVESPATDTTPSTIDNTRIPPVIFPRFLICFHRFRRDVEIYGMFRPAIFSRLDIIEIGNSRKTKFSDLDMSQDDTLGQFADGLPSAA